jgi:hypothetical protein
MSEANPYNNPTSGRSGAAGSPPDFQQLVGLLGDLMPLLLRFQSQVPEQPFQGGLGRSFLQEPTLDHQAAVSLAEDMIGGLLKKLSGYLDANAGQNSGLNNCTPILTQATQNLAAHNYAQALNLIWMVYRAITAIRAAAPKLPPLGSQSSDQHSSARKRGKH